MCRQVLCVSDAVAFGFRPNVGLNLYSRKFGAQLDLKTGYRVTFDGCEQSD